MKSVRQLGVLAGVWVSAWGVSALAQGQPAPAPAAAPTASESAAAPAAPEGSPPDQPPAPPATATAAPAPAPPPSAAPAPAAPPPGYRAPAYGQPPYGQPGYPPQGYYYQQPAYPAPPPPPPPDDTVERHDGLYLGFGLGFGYFRNSIGYSGGPIGDEKVSKGAVAFEFLLGGTPAPGLVIGGGLMATGVSDPNVEVDGQTVKNSDLKSMAIASIGPFVDFYPDDKGGFHVQAFVGYSSLSFETETNGQSDSSEQPEGYSLAGAAGYDFWVGDQWSIGVLGRLTYSSLAVTVNDIDQTHHVLSPMVGFRGLLH